MFISNIETRDDAWLITAQIDHDEEKELFFWAENDAIPIVIELKDYITIMENKVLISIPFCLFGNIEIHEKTSFTLCRNFNIKSSISVAPEINGKKSKMPSGYVNNYELELGLNPKGISIVVERVWKQIKALKSEISNHSILLELDNKEEFIKNQGALYLKRRYTEQLWQYNNKEIFIGNIDNNGYLNAPIPYELFEDNGTIQYFDFIIKLENKNTSAEYFLYSSEEFVSGKLLLSDLQEDEIYRKKFEAYYSAGKNVSLRFTFAERFGSTVEKLDVVDNQINITLSPLGYNDDSAKNFVVKKRTYKNERTYCYSWNKELQKENNKYIFSINCNEFLKGGVKTCDECWDIYIESDNHLFPVNAIIKTDYFEVANGYKICFFTNSEGQLSIYTHESDYKERAKTNIAVLGTCFSRSVFKSTPYFNPDYKKYYDCVYTQYHSSLISLTSEPVKNWVQKDAWNKESIRYMPTELNKDFFEKFKESKAEYLLLDNYIDATRPIIEVGDGTYITYNKYLIRSNLIRDFVQCRFIKPGTEEYLQLYIKHAKLFIEKMKEYIPERNILLLSGRFSYEKIDEKTNKKEAWGGRPFIQRNNLNWDTMDSLLLSIAPQIRVIDMRSTTYVSDAHSPIDGGASPSHYQKYFYREILDKINKCVLEDKMNCNN